MAKVKGVKLALFGLIVVVCVFVFQCSGVDDGRNWAKRCLEEQRDGVFLEGGDVRPIERAIEIVAERPPVIVSPIIIGNERGLVFAVGGRDRSFICANAHDGLILARGESDALRRELSKPLD